MTHFVKRQSIITVPFIFLPRSTTRRSSEQQSQPRGAVLPIQNLVISSKMLRRLGLKAEENGHSTTNISGRSSTSSDSSSSAAPATAAAGAVSRSNSITALARQAVLAPAVDYDRQTRYFKVVYRGSVGVRSCPTEPAPPDGQVSVESIFVNVFAVLG